MAELQFDEASHTYTLNGQEIPSVTTIIGAVVPRNWEAGVRWGMRLANQGLDPTEKRDAAARLGTQVHVAFHHLATGVEVDPFDFPDEAQGFIGGCRRFIDAHGPEFLASERKTYSEKHGYAGTLDAHVKFTKGKFKGKTARIDLKTGKRIYKESHFPQLAAYEQADVERGHDPSDLRFILKVMPTGNYRLVPVTDTFWDFEVLLNHWKSVKAREARD
jgi:hypothetical protein